MVQKNKFKNASRQIQKTRYMWQKEDSEQKQKEITVHKKMRTVYEQFDVLKEM